MLHGHEAFIAYEIEIEKSLSVKKRRSRVALWGKRSRLKTEKERLQKELKEREDEEARKILEDARMKGRAKFIKNVTGTPHFHILCIQITFDYLDCCAAMLLRACKHVCMA